jgi:hypothetical protein
VKKVMGCCWSKPTIETTVKSAQPVYNEEFDNEYGKQIRGPVYISVSEPPYQDTAHSNII